MDSLTVPLTALAAALLGFSAIGWARVFTANANPTSLKQAALLTTGSCGVLAALLFFSIL